MTTDTSAPPYGSYASIMGTFVGGLAVAGVLARLLDRDPQEHTTLDLVALGAGSRPPARSRTTR